MYASGIPMENWQFLLLAKYHQCMPVECQKKFMEKTVGMYTNAIPKAKLAIFPGCSKAISPGYATGMPKNFRKNVVQISLDYK